MIFRDSGFGETVFLGICAGNIIGPSILRKRGKNGGQQALCRES